MTLGAIISSITGSGTKKASKKAVAAAEQAQTQNNALAEKIYTQNSANLAPFIQSGTGAQGTYNALLGINGTTPQQQAQAQTGFNNYLNNFGYNAELQQGSQAITGNQAAKGLLGSGSTLKALQKYGLGDASEDSVVQ